MLPVFPDPLLPPEFVQEVVSNPLMRGYSSSVFVQEAQEKRQAFILWEKPHGHPDLRHNSTDDGGTIVIKSITKLQLCASMGDVLAVCEFLRCGATVDMESVFGHTALYIAMREMANYRNPCLAFLKHGRRMSHADKEKTAQQLEWVARILLEQHADPNKIINSTSVLQLACDAKSWDTVSLLLQHGARPSLCPEVRFTSRKDKARFRQLVEANRFVCRPPQVCPCWSGKLLSECHDKEEKNYPLAFPCVCHSGKTFGRCCHKRGVVVSEKWDRASRRLTHLVEHTARASDELRAAMKGMRDLHDKYAELKSMLGCDPLQMGEVDPKGWSGKTGAELQAKGLIDPAFAFGMSQLDFAPNPRGHNASRAECKKRQVAWNAIIDQYIEESDDPRSRQEIERAAKIGVWNGALIRICEGPGCTRMEGKDVDGLKQCGKCRIAVYCSPKCQKSAWPSHKVVCGCSQGQLEQALPSQVNMMDYTEKEWTSAYRDHNIVETTRGLSELIAAMKDLAALRD